MSRNMRFRGKTYSHESIARAVAGMGYLVWVKFPYSVGEEEAKNLVKETILELSKRGIRLVRLGVSWAEMEMQGGEEWIGWYLKEFRKAGFSVIPNLNYTPKKFAEARLALERADAQGDEERLAYLNSLSPGTNIPPEPISAFADFTERFISRFGHLTEGVIELWNEPNIDTDWLPTLDADYSLYAEMFRLAAAKVREAGMQVLLGGPSKTDAGWFEKVGKLGLFSSTDYIGLHGLRGTWSDKVRHDPWCERIRRIMSAVRENGGRKQPVWITEVGFTTVDLEFKLTPDKLEDIQVAIYADLMLAIADGCADRVYWYTLKDLVHDSVRFVTTGWEDVLQFYFGDITVSGRDKLLGRLLKEGGPARVLEYVEEQALWDEALRVIDRGDPGEWREEKLREAMEKISKLEHPSGA